MAGDTDTTSLRTAQTWEFIESFPLTDDVLRVAQGMAEEFGVEAVDAGTGAMLRILAAAGSARAVIEIGTGTGVSGLWLLRGMRTDGVLTTIDTAPECQQAARRIFAEAGHPPSRTRLITGRALDVLPRLADRAYDLLFLNGDQADYEACVAAAPRLLRAGGVLVINGALAGGRVADPGDRDPHTIALREMVKSLREAPQWSTAIVPVGDGLLCAVLA